MDVATGVLLSLTVCAGVISTVSPVVTVDVGLTPAAEAVVMSLASAVVDAVGVDCPALMGDVEVLATSSTVDVAAGWDAELASCCDVSAVSKEDVLSFVPDDPG